MRREEDNDLKELKKRKVTPEKVSIVIYFAVNIIFANFFSPEHKCDLEFSRISF